MAKAPTAKTVETLKHDEARRKNIPMRVINALRGAGIGCWFVDNLIHRTA
jgi:hypothetical protein